MHKLPLISIFLCLGLILSNCQGIRTSTKRHSPETKINITKSSLDVEVFYNRPYKKGRLIFGKKEDKALVPYGKKWRTGANEATEITFSQDAQINGKKIKAGTYSVYTIPGPKTWIIAINSKTDYWGATLGSPFKEKLDVMRAKVPVQKMEAVTEQFTMSLRRKSNYIELNFMWDQVKVSLPIYSSD